MLVEFGARLMLDSHGSRSKVYTVAVQKFVTDLVV
jgi:hypothetical protein